MILNFAKKIDVAFRVINIDLRMIGVSILRLPRYFSERKRFNELFKDKSWRQERCPALLDRDMPSASLGEYFWQDMFVAKRIISDNPRFHIDVGSRIDGFVAHLACVRPVSVFDIRPLEAIIDNVEFVQWDITNPNQKYRNVADCVSCLHTLEHIGLGRYGDKLDPDGWRKGLASLASLMSTSGQMWLSVPIGIQRVEFNAHRIFSPSTIIEYAKDLGLSLSGFWYLSDKGMTESIDLECDLNRLSSKRYGLGVFLFTNREVTQ